jgi:dTDP-4-dehydrorhamnose 3,5-epimerase-like enzyme/dTDP-4-dehydrorhamnose reductase
MFNDERGKLFFPIKNNKFQFVESTVSINHKNVFRGIHVEQFSKLVTCIQGKILDIVINFNKEDFDYLIPKYFTLDSKTPDNQVFIGSNHGHAFLSLEENSIVLYHFSDVFQPEKTQTYNYMDPRLNIKLPIKEPIVSEKDKNSPFFEKIDFYVFGGNGFIGKVILDSIKDIQYTYYNTKLRLEEVDKIEKELDLFNPKYVISSAGITGNPNISWCEDHQTETIETNITYQMTLAHLCKKKKIHLTIIGSGVIFKNDKYYTEEEEGNYEANFYSKCRIYLENMCRSYDNILYARVNYPISKYQSNRNLITKLLSYSSIDNVEITLTYIDELIPVLINMIVEKETGICNLVNEGSISLIDINKMYENKMCISNKKQTNSEKVVNKSTSLLQLGKLKKYKVMDVNLAVYDCIMNYIFTNSTTNYR